MLLMSGWCGLAGSAGGASGAQKSVMGTVPRLRPYVEVLVDEVVV